jgi:flagella basal body P-ring formation protein FlgA
MSSPSVIKNNDPVNIIYSSGSISLKTVGISMGVGAVGDMIKVKNSSSGAVLLGQIINKNTVQVGGNND